MNKIRTFPSKIKGTVKISGSKNAALPILVASLLAKNKVTLKNVPNIKDVELLLNIYEKLGVTYSFKNNKYIVSNVNLNYQPLLMEEVKQFRASYYLMGLFLTLFRQVEIYIPGGCKIGNRPIDFHLAGFMKAGCSVQEHEDVILIKADQLTPFSYRLPKKSLGATVNLLLLASSIDGSCIIENPSTEPEIDDLINFLNTLGMNVIRYRDRIVVHENEVKNKKVVYHVMPDRIEAVTFMILGAFSKKLCVKNVSVQDLEAPLRYMYLANISYAVKRNKVIIFKSYPRPVNIVSGDYPMLSTDQMPLFYPLFLRCSGTSSFKETIFENRFLVLEELKKSGANIYYKDNIAFIVGNKNILPANFEASDLRCAATLLIASILDGNSTVNCLWYIERGYDNIYEKLRKIGAHFEKVDT